MSVSFCVCLSFIRRYFCLYNKWTFMLQTRSEIHTYCISSGEKKFQYILLIIASLNVLHTKFFGLCVPYIILLPYSYVCVHTRWYCLNDKKKTKKNFFHLTFLGTHRKWWRWFFFGNRKHGTQLKTDGNNRLKTK